MNRKDLTKAVNMVRKDCKKYLDLIRGLHGLFNRGVRSNYEIIIPEILFKKLVRKDREPYGMSVPMARELNKYLVKHGHCDRSKSAIASAAVDIGQFGNAFYFFPIGDFNFTFCKARDMNYNWTYIDSYGGRSDIYNAIKDKKYKTMPKDFFITNDDIALAYNKEYEIWFECDAYYMISGDINEEVLVKLLWRL
jgi:hypothetical protein